MELLGNVGAEGGGTNGGLGARMSGTFELNAGDVIKIQVGQMGIEESSSAGGGGGDSLRSKLLVAVW